jgi:hypothetical protein
MSYTRRAYVDMAKILADEIELTEESDNLSEAELDLAVETISLVGEKIADLFERDNPRMFDRALFLNNAKINPTD